MLGYVIKGTGWEGCQEAMTKQMPELFCLESRTCWTLVLLPSRTAVNVISVDNSSSLSTMLWDQITIAEQAAEHFPREALIMLSDNLNEKKALLPKPDVAALAMAGGYMAKTTGERASCEECLSLLTKPSSSAPSDVLIEHHNWGGRLYLGELLHVLHSLRKYIEVALAKWRNLKCPLNEAMDNAPKVLREPNLLTCTVLGHHEQWLDVLLTKFFDSLFTNFAMKVTAKHDFVRVLEVKQLSRKVLKLWLLVVNRVNDEIKARLVECVRGTFWSAPSYSFPQAASEFIHNKQVYLPWPRRRGFRSMFSLAYILS